MVFLLAVCLTVVISLGLRIVYLNQRSLWFDEASSWLTCQMSRGDLLASLKQSTHVPLYYPILRSWMGIFGDSPTALRGFSVLFGMLTICGCGLLGRRLTPTGQVPPDAQASDVNSHHISRLWFGLFCAALCGFNGFQVLASVEARMYSLGTFLTVLSTLATLNVAQAPERKRNWGSLVCVTTVSLYTHHFLALTAGIQAMWLLGLLWTRRQVRPQAASAPVLRYWLIAVVSVAVLWIPGLWLWAIQMNRIHTDFWIPPLSFWSVPETCFDFFAAPPPGRRREFHGLALCASLVVALLLHQSWRRKQPVLLLLWLQAVVPMLLIALVSLRTPLWESRYFRFTHVSLLLCLAVSLWSLSSRVRFRTVTCSAALIVSLAGSLLFWTLRDIPNRQAVRGAMSLIDSQESTSPTNVVVVTSPIHFIVARYYADQLGWPAERVKLWTGEDRDPGAAVHLIDRADWWDGGTAAKSETVWVLSSGFPENVVGHVTSPEYEFPSDNWIGSWTVTTVRLELRMPDE